MRTTIVLSFEMASMRAFLSVDVSPETAASMLEPFRSPGRAEATASVAVTMMVRTTSNSISVNPHWLLPALDIRIFVFTALLVVAAQ